MGYHSWPYETLKAVSSDIFKSLGFSEEDSAFITDVLLQSDLAGIESHGIQRLYRYYQHLKKGVIDPAGQPEIVRETPVSAVVDGHNGMGHLIAKKAMELTIRKAKETGIGMVTVRNSNHYGIAGYYARMACKEGFLGVSCTSTNAIVVPTYGRTAMLGTNPIAVAMPADPCDFCFDAATSVVTRGNLEVHGKAGEPLPDGWAVDEDGVPTTDAPRVLGNISGKRGGGILPLGGSSMETGSHKGYGYGMVCELLCSILSLGVTSAHAGEGGAGGICHFFLAADPALFGDPAEIRKHFSAYLNEIRQSPKAAGQERIYIHGEKEAESKEKLLKEGIPVNDNTLREIIAAAGSLDLDPARYFGDYVPEEDKAFRSFY